jgi:hypothetical protein
MYKLLSLTIVGTAPLVMHNGQTADPLNKYAKMLKAISAKRKKTEADYEELARIEFVAGLYMDRNGPVIPARVLEATVAAGARKSKLGKQVQAGVIVERHAPLIYDGPRMTKELFEDERFRLAVPVRVGQVKVVRTRPIFVSWSAVIELSYLEDIVNPTDLTGAVRAAGLLVGLGDWRPRYGRFALQQDLPQAVAA